MTRSSRPAYCRSLHFAPKAKHVIYLFMSGGPSHIDLFDYKPRLKEHFGQELPAFGAHGPAHHGHDLRPEDLAGRPSMFKFAQHGKAGTWVSELLPNMATIVDDIAVVKSLQHRGDQPRPGDDLHPDRQPAAGPAEPGRVALATASAARTRTCPTFVVHDLAGQRQQDRSADLLAAVGQRLPAERASRRALPQRASDPVLYLSNPRRRRSRGPTQHARRRRRAEQAGRASRSAIRRSTRASSSTRWPFACRASVPELTDLSKEPKKVIEDVRHRRHRRRTAASPATACSPGAWSNAACASCNSCIAAGISTATCRTRFAGSARTSIKPAAALVKDLKRRGLLDDTLVIWGGEFGRTVYSQGALTKTNYGRDHHGRCFTMWMAGGGIKPGITLRRDRRLRLQHRQGPGPHPRLERDDPASAWASITRKLTFRFQGRDFRLTDVHGNIVKGLIA